MSTTVVPAPEHPTTAPLPIPGAQPARAGEPGLTADELAHFHEKGWVLKRGVFSRERIAALVPEVDGLHEAMARPAERPGVELSWEPEQAPGRPRRLRQLLGSELVCPGIDALSRSEEILAIMRQLIGPDVWLYHSKLMMKAAQDGSFTPWHQDFQYWHRESWLPTHVNCMLSIDASDEANGALRMVDGSHRQGLLPAMKFRTSSFSTGLAGGLDAYPATLVETSPGDVILFGSYVIHGSGPNGSDRDRRANTFAYDRPGNWRPGIGGQEALPASHYRCGRRPG